MFCLYVPECTKVLYGFNRRQILLKSIESYGVIAVVELSELRMREEQQTSWNWETEKAGARRLLGLRFLGGEKREEKKELREGMASGVCCGAESRLVSMSIFASRTVYSHASS